MSLKDNQKNPTSELDGITDSEAVEVTKDLDGPQPAYIPPGGNPKLRFRDKLKKILKSRKFWSILISSIILITIFLWFIQPTRAWLINLVGQRTHISITVNTSSEDGQASAKLKNVTVDVNGNQYTTDDEGLIEINDQPYGNVHISIAKRGYEEMQTDRYLDFDPFFYKFGGQEADESYRDIKIELKSVGLPVSFTAIDSLSGQPITEGYYIAGDLKLTSDEKGVVNFKAPPQDGQKISITSDFQGVYNDKTFDILFDKENQEIKFIPAGRDYFLSARDGAISLYSADLDGGNLKMIIPGTGKESSETAYATSPSGKYGVLASTREGKRNENNTLMQYLYVVDLEKRIITKIDEAKYFQFYDWSGDKLIYTAQATDPEDESHQASIRVANMDETKYSELSSAYSYGKIIVSDYDRAVFVENIQNVDSNISSSVKRVSLDSDTVKEIISNSSSVVQTDTQTVFIQSSGDQKWSQYDFNSDSLKDSPSPSGSLNRVFLSSANNANTFNIVIDRIDGKFVIISKSKESGSEKELYSSSSITGPIRWVQDSVIIFRIINDKETADYAISIKGGQPQKITDITATSYPSSITRDINQLQLY